MAKNRKFSALVLIGLILMTVSSQVKAQSWYEEEQRVFSGGLLLGSNFSQIDGDRFAGYHKVGLNTGAIVYAQLANHFAGSVEILYSQRGSRAHKPQPSSSGAYSIGYYRIHLNYAEVPVQLHYFDKRKSHFGAGFSYAQLINTKEEVEANVPILSRNTGEPIDFEKEYPFRKFDINFIIGGNLMLYKGLFLNARFQYSILPVRTNIEPELGRNEQFNNTWVLRLMYLFQ